VADPVQLADGVVRLGTRFVNWYLVADGDAVTVVDAGVSGYRPQLEPGLALLGRRLSDIAAVVLTHGDPDHTGLAAAIRSEAGAPVHLHPDDEVLVTSRKPKKTDGSLLATLPHRGLWQIGAHLARNGALTPPKVQDTVPLAEGMTLDVPGRPRVLHTPGHTPGHVLVHFADHGTVFTGDALCTWNVLTGDRGPRLMPSSMNVSTPGARESLDRLEEVDAALVLPGHGDPWTDSAAEAAARAREADAP
jgi:glyoxylase-like metal-dependent hydrolase (beta-lactamase superfamily II)